LRFLALLVYNFFFSALYWKDVGWTYEHSEEIKAMGEGENDILVTITARRNNRGITFSIEWKKELDKQEVKNILDEIIQGIYALKREQNSHTH